MIAALLYLHITSLKNAVLVRLRRLKQPRYLAGFVVGVLYFYFFVFRHWFKGQGFKVSTGHIATGHAASPGVTAVMGPITDWMQLIEPVAALILLIVVAFAWILPRSRDVLRFTEAEVAFLFTAPIPRSTLIHYKLLRSQLGILFTALLLSLFSMRMQMLGGSAWTHALAYWIIFSTINLHLVASSFTHERLLGMGLNPWLRRALALVLLIVLGVGAYVWVRQAAPAGTLGTDFDLVRYAQAFLNAPPLSWALFPFELMVRPFLAQTAGAFLLAVWPALLIMAAHYIWVLRSQVAFEEAALSYAQKRAERLVAIKSGRLKSLPDKARKEPFRLAPLGHKSLAFLWRGLITAGWLSYPRVWLRIALAVAVGAMILSRNPALAPFRLIVSTTCMLGAVWLLIFGPLLTRRGIPQMLERLDIVKTFPVRGWQVVLGEMLTPLFILTAIEWTLLLAITLCGVPDEKFPEIVKVLVGPGAIGVAVLAPPILGLMVSISFAAALLFPAWMGSMGAGRSGGIEVMGQRIIFSFGYLLTFIVCLLPAALLGAIPYLLIYFLTHSYLFAILATALSAGLVLAGELAGVIWWLGQRYERIDISIELPRT